MKYLNAVRRTVPLDAAAGTAGERRMTMREIKGPRVWDDVLGKMLYSKFEQYDDSIGFRFSEHLETENPVYMWPSGLKDKNGKEIYEGDICRGVDFKLKVEFMSVAKWHKNGYWYAFNKEGKGIGFLNNIELLEVIGNIYENPELLE